VNYKRLGELRTEVGDRRFAMQITDDIRSGKFPVAEASLKGLWEACGSPHLTEWNDVEAGTIVEENIAEAPGPSFFPTITGSLINKVVQDAYMLDPGVGMQVVQVIDSAQKDDTIVGVSADDELMEIEPGNPYPEGMMGEKYHKIRNRKWGRMISLTEETVKFDQTGQLARRAANIGSRARSKQEEIIFDAVLGLVTTGAYASWRPAGTATTLYSDTSNDPYTSGTLDNNITETLADETDIDAAMVKLGAMTDEQGRYIAANPDTLLVGVALRATAQKLVGSSASLVSEKNAGVINIWQGLTAHSSPWVDAGLSALYWLFGEFKKQFVYTQVFPLQVRQMKAGADAQFNRDVALAWRVRFMGGCGAVSNRYVIRSTGAG